MSALGRMFVLFAVGSLLLASGCGGGAADRSGSNPGNAVSVASDSELTIAIGGIVTAGPAFQYYRGLAEYVGRKVGTPVRVIHKTDYAEVNQMLKEGRVDVAFMGAGAYVRGHDESGLELVAAPVVRGKPSFRSYIIVPKSSPATSLASLKGKTFAFTDRSPTPAIPGRTTRSWRWEPSPKPSSRRHTSLAGSTALSRRWRLAKPTAQPSEASLTTT